MPPSVIFKTIKDEARTRLYNLLFYVFFQHTLAPRRKEMILFFHPKSSSEKLLFSVSYDTIESNAKRMKHSLLQFLKHASRKKNYCWQEELSVWISAEVNCLVFVMEYNSYNSTWVAATNKLIKTVSWDPGVHQSMASTNVPAHSLNHRDR